MFAFAILILVDNLPNTSLSIRLASHQCHRAGERLLPGFCATVVIRVSCSEKERVSYLAKIAHYQDQDDVFFTAGGESIDSHLTGIVVHVFIINREVFSKGFK